MKKILLSLCALSLVLVGFGCSNIIGSKNEKVSGNWYLSFNLPEGWSAYSEYNVPRDLPVTPTQTINKDMKIIVLQNTTKAIVPANQKPTDAVPVDTYVMDNYSQIDVYKLDPHYSVSKAAQDLGNGFKTADGKYFFTAADGSRYQFVIKKTEGQSDDVIKNIILSAKLVTDYTGPAVSATVGDVKTGE